MAPPSSPAQPGMATEVDVQGSPSILSDLASLASQVQQMSADNAFSQQQMQQMHASQAVVQRQMQVLLALLQQSNQPQQLATPQPPPKIITPPPAPAAPTQPLQIPTGPMVPTSITMHQFSMELHSISNSAIITDLNTNTLWISIFRPTIII